MMHCKQYGNHRSVLHFLRFGPSGKKEQQAKTILRNSRFLLHRCLHIKKKLAYVPISYDRLTLLFPSNQLLHLEIPPLDFPTNKDNGERHKKRRRRSKHC